MHDGILFLEFIERLSELLFSIFVILILIFEALVYHFELVHAPLEAFNRGEDRLVQRQDGRLYLPILVLWWLRLFYQLCDRVHGQVCLTLFLGYCLVLLLLWIRSQPLLFLTAHILQNQLNCLHLLHCAFAQVLRVVLNL